MAAKKKKSKAAAGPARGFATVSTASKSKATEAPKDEQPTIQATEREEAALDTPADVDQFAGRKAGGSSEVTPAQLEAQLEHDELQLLVDKYSDQIKKDAARTAARIKTERRLQRNQADAINIRPWLSDELMDKMYERLAVEEESSNHVKTSYDHLAALFNPYAALVVITCGSLPTTLWELDSPASSGPAIVLLRFYSSNPEYIRLAIPPDLLTNKELSALKDKSSHVHDKIQDQCSYTTKAEGVHIIPVTEDALTRLWMLRHTLRRLDFLDEDIDWTLLWLSQSVLPNETSSRIRTSAWGLEEALEFLAQYCPVERLPDYYTYKNVELERIAEAERQAKEQKLLEEEQRTRAAEEEIVEQKQVEAMTADLNHTVEPAVESSSEDENAFDEDDPKQMIEEYVKLMMRLHKHRPDLTEIKTQAKKKGKQHGPQSQKIQSTPHVQRLLTKLRALEADVLFDADEAMSTWSARRLDVVAGEYERRKVGLTEKRPRTNVPIASQELPQPLATAETDEDDDLLGLDDFMSSLPEETTNANGTATMSIASETGTRITVRDFGKWSGVSPRRVLEDTCKARDTNMKVILKPLTHHGMSKRHALEVRWPQPQDLMPDCPIPEVSLESSLKHAKFTMVEISTTDSAQSEAYISVVALFGLFATSAKEEKTYMRLPPVWRELYMELKSALKDKVDAADREELKSLRQIAEAGIRASASSQPMGNTFRLQANGDVKAPADNIEIVDTKRSHQTIQDPQSLMQLWSTKSNSPSFKKMVQHRANLPIWSYKKELLAAVEAHQVVIVCGETGCGKSTQTPNFILEHELSQGKDCKIYCTEPRRISAISLARRVSQELGESQNDLGTPCSLVGYSIRLESKISVQTRLVYATTGVVMRMLERDTGLNEITHLVLDEVHERTIDSDFLLIILRRLMVRRPSLKVILMSATVNAEKFSSYLNGAPVFNIPGRMFPVETKYLEDVIEITKFGKHSGGGVDRKSYHKPSDTEDASDEIEAHDRVAAATSLEGYSISTKNALKEYNEYRINYELMVKLLETIATDPKYRKYSNAILVFLPGIAEIRRLNDMLVGHSIFAKGWNVYPLHSTIATEEQEQAFLVPLPGVRKIVLATNIAETGITIPDITCVVDTGTHKEMRYDERRQLSRLIEAFISKANAKQRRGRAGRVQNGLCFHLFTRARHDRLMTEQQTPEIMRLSLQDLVLRVKICQMGSIEETLSEALDPPLPRNVRRAIDALVEVKALTNGEDLTALGRQLAKLPLDVFLGKLLLLGSIFKCLDSCLSIAAILSSKSPFSAPMSARSQADQVKMGFKRGDSDLLTVYNAYCAWRRVCQNPGSSEHDFCRKNFLSSQTLVNIEELKGQLSSSLVEAGFLRADDQLKSSLSRVRGYSRRRHFIELPTQYTYNDPRETVVNSVIAWSFYPKLLTREGKGWRNVANNQTVSLHPNSVNRGSSVGRYLSFYHIMQSASKAYNAHETSVVEDFAVALVCGDADFKLYSGSVVIDSNRLRFALPSWKSMLALKQLRKNVREILSQSFKSPGKPLSETHQAWMDLLQKCFEDRKDL